MATKKKAKAVETLDAPVVTVEDTAPAEEVTVELDAETAAEPDVFVLMQLHERDGGWWGCAVTFPGGEHLSLHAPTRSGVESAAYRVINAKAPTMPVVIQFV